MFGKYLEETIDLIFGTVPWLYNRTADVTYNDMF